MDLDQLVNKQGRLAETLPQFDRSTIQHADEITTARRTDKELRKKWFWTGDHFMYTMENSTAAMYLGRVDTIANDISIYTNQV